MKIIPIAMISDDNFVMPTCVALTSMIINKAPETFYDITLFAVEVSENSKAKILGLLNLDKNIEIHIVDSDLDKYSGIKQLAHISPACLLKFDVCESMPQHDKILYLDGDIIVRKDLADLYDIDIADHYAAGVKELNCIINDRGNINAGIMLFNAKKIRDEKLTDILVKTRLELGDRGSMDQQTFNMVIGKNYKYIPLVYNCILTKIVGEEKTKDYSIDRINELYKLNYNSNEEVVNDAYIWHFATSTKPWKYTFAYGAKEWYSYYLKSTFKNEPFVLRSRFSYRVYHMQQAFKKAGLKGIWSRVADKINRLTTKSRKIEWE